MKHVRPIALAVIAMIGLGLVAIATAQDSPSANVEVRVWQSTGDAESLYISARPEGGSWVTLGTIPLDMSGLNDRETYRYGDIMVGVEIPGLELPAPIPTETPAPTNSNEPQAPPDPVPEPEPVTVNVEVRVWQSTGNAQNLYISARQEDGDWRALGTIPLDMSGLNSRGTYRYGDISLDVTVVVEGLDPEIATSDADGEDDETPWVDPRPDGTYTLQQLAELPPPQPPSTPLKPRHIMALEIPTHSNRRSQVVVSLVEDAINRVTVSLTHTYQGRDYNVLCEASMGSNFRRVDYVPCEYDGEMPFDSSGTDYLSFWATLNRYYHHRAPALVFVSATLDGTAVVCEQPNYVHHCYDSNVYKAWEKARDQALDPATDPLERYLRQEDGPPLWWQSSPYEGGGPYTTGVFEVDPYVTYTLSWIDMPPEAHNRFLEGLLVCVSYTDRDGVITSIDKDSIGAVFLWMLNNNPASNGKSFQLRQPFLCEFEIVSEHKWGFTLASSE